MKSVHELVIEKLDAEIGAPKILTQEEKQKIEEIDEQFNEKLAKQKLFLEKKLIAIKVEGKRMKKKRYTVS